MYNTWGGTITTLDIESFMVIGLKHALKKASPSLRFVLRTAELDRPLRWV